MRRFLTPVFGRAVLARAAALGLGAPGLMALRLLERGEAFSPRTGVILAFLGGAGLLGGFVVYGLTGLMGRLPRAVRFLAGVLLSGPAVAGVFYLFFAIDLRGGDLDAPHDGEDGHDSYFHFVLGTLIDALGFLIVTGRPYFLPWTLPAIALAGGLIAVAEAWRRPRWR